MRISREDLIALIREEKQKSTKKYDDAEELTGDQDKLPDNLQKAIIDKEKKKNESALRRRLRRIVVEECPGGMTGEPEMASADSQMSPAPAPDLDSAMPCPIKTASKMKEAGATEAELMDFVNTLIDEFRAGGTTVPEEPAQIAHADGPEGDGVGDLLSILGL